MENERLKKRMCKWAIVCGIMALVFYILHDLIGGLYYPDYEWMKQAVSDLTALDAPSYQIAGVFSHVYGIFSCICWSLLCIMAYELNKTLKLGIYLFGLMNAISAIGYAAFPLSSAGYDGSFSSFMHTYVVTTAVVLLSIISLILIAIGSFKDQHKTYGTLALICLACMFFGAMGTALFPKEVFGIIERFSTYAAVVFTAVSGIYAGKLFVK